jgi:hypothetical protein
VALAVRAIGEGATGQAGLYYPPLEERIELDLVETRTFASRVVYLRHRRRS